jgi:hypothetical protein
MKITYSISELAPYINWVYYFYAWQVKDEVEKQRMQREALVKLQELENKYQVHAVFELFDARSEDDDIVIIDGVKKRKVIKPTVLYVLPGMVDAYKQLGKKGWMAFCDIREMSEEMYKKLMVNGITTDIAVADTESDIRITANDGRITVTGVKPNTTIRVYDTSGRLVAVHSINDGSDIRIDAKGTYVVKVGDTTYKVMN